MSELPPAIEASPSPSTCPPPAPLASSVSDSKAGDNDVDPPLVPAIMRASFRATREPSFPTGYMGVFWQHTLGKSWDRSILTQEDVSAELARRGFEDGDPMDHIRGRYTFPRDDVVLMKTLNMMVKLCCDWQGGDYRRVCGFYKAPYVYAIDNHGAIMRRLEEDGYWVDEAAGKRWGVQFLLIHEAPRNIVEKMGDWYTGRVAITDESFAVLKERGICQAPKFVGVRYEDA